MGKHEEKYCPHCGASFECKVGDITHCQCFGMKFTQAERYFIGVKYSDCLCAACMLALQSEYNIAQREFIPS